MYVISRAGEVGTVITKDLPRNTVVQGCLLSGIGPWQLLRLFSHPGHPYNPLPLFSRRQWLFGRLYEINEC